MGFLFRLYINALLKGNPFGVAVTAIGVLALSVGPFYRGVSSGDPAAIGLAVLVFVGVLVVPAVAIIDRRNNAPRGKGRGPTRSGH